MCPHYAKNRPRQRFLVTSMRYAAPSTSFSRCGVAPPSSARVPLRAICLNCILIRHFINDCLFFRAQAERILLPPRAAFPTITNTSNTNCYSSHCETAHRTEQITARYSLTIFRRMCLCEYICTIIYIYMMLCFVDAGGCVLLMGFIHSYILCVRT